jgi:hypothetical protein
MEPLLDVRRDVQIAQDGFSNSKMSYHSKRHYLQPIFVSMPYKTRETQVNNIFQTPLAVYGLIKPSKVGKTPNPQAFTLNTFSTAVK